MVGKGPHSVTLMIGICGDLWTAGVLKAEYVTMTTAMVAVEQVLSTSDTGHLLSSSQGRLFYTPSAGAEAR